jgi:hypothetical protein
MNFILFAHYIYNYELKEDEVGGACGVSRGEEERV